MKEWVKDNIDMLVVMVVTAMAINEIYMSNLKVRSNIGLLTKIGLLTLDVTLMYRGIDLSAVVYRNIKNSVKELVDLYDNH